MPWVPGLNVRILTHERARVGRQSLVDALVALVRQRGLAGITVTRALEGYTHRGGMRTSGVVELGDDLPLIVEIIDRAERIEAALPEIAAMVSSGVLSVTDARVYFPATSLRVRDVMSAPKVIAHPETSLAEVLPALLERGVRLVPVTSRGGKLEGILTIGHLLQSLDPALATHLLQLPSPEQIRAYLERAIDGHTAVQSMLTQPFVLEADQPLDAAARALTLCDVTRAPVVDSAGHLAGILSEREVVAALVGPLTRTATGESTQEHRMTLRQSVTAASGELVTAGSLAERGITEVGAAAPLDEVIPAVQASLLGMVLVVDPQGHLRGVINEHDLLAALLPGTPAGVGAALRHLVQRARPQSIAPSKSVPGRPQTAEAIIHAPHVTVPEAMPAAEALAAMMREQQSDVAVVLGPEGVPVGVLTRQAALRALVGG